MNTKAEIQQLIKSMSPKEMEEALVLLDEIEARAKIKKCQDNIIDFVLHMMPDYKLGPHLKKLYKLLTAIECGDKDRIIVNCAPRFGKSLAISTYFPAWYIGRNPTHKLIIASHTSDLAVDFLRKVRNIMQTEEYRTIFPDVAIAADAKAAGKWNTTQGGEAYAVGVGGALAGRGGNLVIVDDPFSEQDVINGNYAVFDKVYEWFTYGLRTRLMPGGKIAILHCMTGDTQVMLADKTHKLLRDIKPNDLIASYDNGIIRPARVVNWANQGADNIYTMTLKSGIVLRANERHPFLVEVSGVREWIKVKNLKKGMKLVAIQDAIGQHEERHKRVFAKYVTTESGDTKRNRGGYRKQNKKPITHALLHHVIGYLDLRLSRVSATLVKVGVCTIRKTLTPLIDLWVDMVNGSEKNAVRKVVINPHLQKLCATTTTIKIGETKNKNKVYHYTALNKEGVCTLRRGMELPQSNMTLCEKNNRTNALYVGQNLTQIIHRTLGKTINWLWTIAMKLEKYEVYCATTVTLYSKRGSPEQHYYGPLSTLSVSLDELVSIEYTGVEDVYDIEVEETENFIANGIVSHNTRWSTKDLTSRLLRDAKLKPDADQYEHFKFPAIMDEGTDTERSLWPEQWPLEALLRTKATMPAFQWCAQYQQNPISEGAGIVQKAWFKQWEKDTPPPITFIVQAIDAAVEDKKRSDFNAITTWGVWFNEEENRNSLILLNSLNFRAEFPKLKQVTKDEYNEWEPDSLIIEAKANGAPLIQELRMQGVPVQSYIPHRGTGDKTARLNYVADIIKDGLVWVPQTQWAQELVEQVNQFPAGDNDDLVDSMVLALFRFRQGGFLRLKTDYDNTDSEDAIRSRGPRQYY